MKGDFDPQDYARAHRCEYMRVPRGTWYRCMCGQRWLCTGDDWRRQIREHIGPLGALRHPEFRTDEVDK